MNILFVHNKYQYRGGEDAVVDMEIDILERQGHRTLLLDFHNDDIQSFGSKIKAGLQAFYNRQSAARLRKEIDFFRPDIIHVHNLFFQASPSVLYEAARARVPVIMTVHNYRFICANAILLRDGQVCERCVQNTFPLQGIIHKCYRGSAIESALVTGVSGIHKMINTWEKKIDRIITPSLFLKQRLAASSFHYPESRIIVKPNFVNDVPADGTQREDFFLFVGRITKEKGIETLLHSFAADLNPYPDSRLVIAGDGPDKQYLLETIKNIPSISYIGPQSKDQVLTLMRRSQALIFPSIWYEGLPVTIVEAFLTGTPVLASRLGAMAEMITDGYNGLHFHPGDPRDLQRCISRFQASRILRDDLYRQARRTYEDIYHPDSHYASIIHIYNNALSSQ